MLLEAVGCPIRYQWPQGEILLNPGVPIEVEELRGLKILAKCGSNIRMVSKMGEALTGKAVHFFSPLFGDCTGRVVMEDGDIVIVEEHSVFHGTATIYRNWICGVE